MVKQVRKDKQQQDGSVEITELDELLGPPPLLPNESLVDYEALKVRLRAKIVPRDVLEEIWLRDILDLQWEVLRMRRLKARLLASSSPSGLESLLRRRVSYYDVEKFVDAWGRGKMEDIRDIEQLLENRGLSLDDVDAHSFLIRLEPLEAIDRMISQAEVRRNNALREIERARETAARKLRAALSDEDGPVVNLSALGGSS